MWIRSSFIALLALAGAALADGIQPGGIGQGLGGGFNFDAGLGAKTSAPVKTIVLLSGSTWTAPADFNPYNNKIEVIAGGGAAGWGHIGVAYSPGGGGAAYAQTINVPLVAGSSYAFNVGLPGLIGAGPNTNGGDGTDSYFCNSTSNCGSISGTAVVVGAKAGHGGQVGSPNGTGGLGGDGALGIGGLSHGGGNGVGGAGLGSGGGAGGPIGGGANGNSSGSSAGFGGAGGGAADNGSAGSSSSTTTGGNGGNNNASAGGGLGGVATLPGAPGLNGGGGGGGGGSTGAANAAQGASGGTELLWNNLYGPGAGAGSAGSTFSGPIGANGADGAPCGGGGSGGGLGSGSDGIPGRGGIGCIAITYAPDGVPLIPQIALAAGFTKLAFFDAMSSTATVDVNNTLAGSSCNSIPGTACVPTFNWYMASGAWQNTGSTFHGTYLSPPNSVSVSGGAMSVSPPDNAHSAAPSGYTITTAAAKGGGYVGTTFSGGLFARCLLAYDPAFHTTPPYATFWGIDILSLMSISGTPRENETDVMEGSGASGEPRVNVIDWVGSSGGSPPESGNDALFVYSQVVAGAYHTYDWLWLTQAQNGGTGVFKYYRDGVLGGTVTYSSAGTSTPGPNVGTNFAGVYSAIESNLMPLSLGGAAGSTMQVKNCQVWQHP